MGAWLDRLKIQKPPDTYATKSTKTVSVVSVACPPGGLEKPEGVFVDFVAYPQGHLEKFEGTGQQPDTQAANDAAPDPDGDCWPHSSAWNTSEIELFNRRAALFVRRGVSDTEAERLADALVQRDRDEDDRHACMECRHLQGYASWRCGNWQAAGVAVRPGDAGLARTMAMQLQRCPGFAAAALPATAQPFVAAAEPAASPTSLQASGLGCSPDAPRRNPDRVCQTQGTDCQ